jgi:hypothetical protein
MKAYIFKATEPTNPKPGQGKDHVLYIPPPPNVIQTMEDPHSSDAPMRMCELLITDTTRHNTRICQLDVIVAFLQETMRIRVR